MRTSSLCIAALVTLFLLVAATQEHGPAPAHRDAAGPGNARTIDPEECLMCHDDEALTMERNGAEVSLYVDPNAYTASAHGELACTDCHEGFDPEEEPHREAIVPVDCGSCHEASAADFRTSGHRGELSCTSCHTEIHAARTVRTDQHACTRCHDEEEAAVAASVHGHAEVAAACLDCHSPHAGARVPSDRCLTCHGDPAYAAEHMAGQDSTAIALFEQSVHAGEAACVDCHAGHAIRAVDDPASAVARAHVAETCAACHDDVAAAYLTSEHGRALAEGFETAPTCTDCHGEHDIHAVTDAGSHISRATEVQVCLSCHLDSDEVRARMTHSSAFISSYTESAHGLAAAEGNTETAVCSDCHGAHQAMKASDPASMTHKANLAETCGACHDEVEAAFMASTHGHALVEGSTDAPTCTTCHGEHGILAHDNEGSPVAAANVSAQVCSPCHNSYKLSQKYGFPSDRVASFGDSYHGLATRFGSNETANCASCHGVHDILPSTDPQSRVNQANLAATCGACHPGANFNFAKGAVHVIRSPEGDRLLWWISTLYLFAIVGLVGAMFLHNVLDWFRKLIDRHRERHGAPSVVERKSRLFLRMTVNERVQHALLASSFILLVVTGFVLKFPDAWWVRGLREMGGTFFFDLRGLLHRVAAVVMVGTAFYHLYYVAFTERGRQFIRDIMVRGQDLKDLWTVLRYNVGRTRQRPAFGRFNYVEKSEYWALVWGTVIMTVTGVVLWFENTFMGAFSKLFVDVNETVHYYEAWLAFLAIVVWHVYYVIFNPDVYPMNLTWLTGTVTEEEMEKEHPAELEQILEREGEAA